MWEGMGKGSRMGGKVEYMTGKVWRQYGIGGQILEMEGKKNGRKSIVCDREE